MIENMIFGYSENVDHTTGDRHQPILTCYSLAYLKPILNGQNGTWVETRHEDILVQDWEIKVGHTIGARLISWERVSKSIRKNRQVPQRNNAGPFCALAFGQDRRFSDDNRTGSLEDQAHPLEGGAGTDHIIEDHCPFAL